jgi:hypothetical protein
MPRHVGQMQEIESCLDLIRAEQGPDARSSLCAPLITADCHKASVAAACTMIRSDAGQQRGLQPSLVVAKPTTGTTTGSAAMAHVAPS